MYLQSLQADRTSCFNATLPCFSNLFSKSLSSPLCFFWGRENFALFNELRGAQEEQDNSAQQNNGAAQMALLNIHEEIMQGQEAPWM